MSFFWRAIGLADSVPGFPFSPIKGSSTISVTTIRGVTWTMAPGTSSEDGLAVTIFSTSLAEASASTKELSRHAMKRAKGMLLPGLLRCYGATEHQDTVYIATESCEPLGDVCEREQKADSKSGNRSGDNNEVDEDSEEAFQESVALGLKTISTALIALHQNKFIHGNVSCDSVFVLPNSEWRLFGLELVSMFDEDGSVYQRYAALLPEHRQPPEVQQKNAGRDLQVSGIDSWGMSCLMYEVFVMKGQKSGQFAQSCSANDMRGCRTLPRTLQSAFVGLCAANPKMRHDVERFISSSDFITSSEFVQCIQGLDDFSLKDAAGREAFMEHLGNVVGTFPLRACKTLVLQKLQATFTYGILPGVVEPIIKIASRITSQEEYNTNIAPIIVTLFRSSDKMLRFRLLQRSAELLPRIPPDIVNEQIWPEFVLGFSSRVAGIREHTARALVPLARNLSVKTLTNDVPRFISQLQQDAEAAIRTNATIALCMIADVLPAEQRSHILVHRFGCMLKDGFVPSRVAALRSFNTTMKFFTTKHIADLVTPGIAPLAMDSVGEVRELALEVLRGAIVRLEEHHRDETTKGTEEADTVNKASCGTAAAATSSGGSKWVWSWSSSSSPVTATTTAGTSAGPVNTGAGAGVVNASDNNNRSSSSVLALKSETTSATRSNANMDSQPHLVSTGKDVLAPPHTTTAGANSSDESWGDEIDLKCSETLKPSSTHAPFSGGAIPQRAKLDVTESPSSCGKAIKLRKKGIGASRLP
ncbi:hypothetical protein TRVL_01862 [Trypanosoma vivax]|nr:hypothetical protein TRVL_01862 [Trypanosoma vivax]